MIVVWLEMLAEYFSRLDTGRWEVRWLELHAGDRGHWRDGWRLRRKLRERRGAAHQL